MNGTGVEMRLRLLNCEKERPPATRDRLPNKSERGQTLHPVAFIFQLGRNSVIDHDARLRGDRLQNAVQFKYDSNIFNVRKELLER